MNQLPTAVAAERAILGAILLENDHYAECATLRPNDFSLDAHRRIYAAMGALMKDGKGVDTITLMEELTRRDELRTIGGAAYLAALPDGLPARRSVRQYASTVREKAVLRRLIHGRQGSSTRPPNRTRPWPEWNSGWGN